MVSRLSAERDQFQRRRSGSDEQANAEKHECCDCDLPHDFSEVRHHFVSQQTKQWARPALGNQAGLCNRVWGALLGE